MSGFGHTPLGADEFGYSNWARIVLWDELPDEVKEADLNAGGYYKKFTEALLPSFNELRHLIYGFSKHIADPNTARKDLLRYIADKFGVFLDYAEPDAYQRTRIEIAGRWRLIKGSNKSFEVLCAVHGFGVKVSELWWNGQKYTTTGSLVSNEIVGYIEP